MNEMLVTIKVEEIVFMTRNVVVPFIKVEDCRDMNIHVFEIINTKWVFENTVLRRTKISDEARMKLIVS